MLYRVSIFVLATAMLAAPASATTVPAITAFDDAFAKINNYTLTGHVHEVLDGHTQDRVYASSFQRPHFARTQILAGPGTGGGAVWSGGDTVSGHQGGILSFVHLTVGLHDSRAISLRGYTIVDGLLQNQVDKYRLVPGQLTQRRGPVIEGQSTDEVELKPADRNYDHGITRMVIYISTSTHFPVRQIRYVGDAIVQDESWLDLKTNVGNLTF